MLFFFYCFSLFRVSLRFSCYFHENSIRKLTIIFTFPCKSFIFESLTRKLWHQLSSSSHVIISVQSTIGAVQTIIQENYKSKWIIEMISHFCLNITLMLWLFIWHIIYLCSYLYSSGVFREMITWKIISFPSSSTNPRYSTGIQNLNWSFIFCFSFFFKN